MNQVLFWGSKDRVVGEAKKVGSVNSLMFWCHMTFSPPPGVPGQRSWNFKASLTRTFVVSGSSLSFYSSWKMPKIPNFHRQMMRYTSQWLVSNPRLPAPGLLVTLELLGNLNRASLSLVGVSGDWCWLTSVTHIHSHIALALGFGYSAT